MVPGEVPAFGREVVPSLQAILGDGLRGACFVGSVALGGYVPDQSDIDIVAVSEDASPDEMKPSLADAVFDTTRSESAGNLTSGRMTGIRCASSHAD